MASNGLGDTYLCLRKEIMNGHEDFKVMITSHGGLLGMDTKMGKLVW